MPEQAGIGNEETILTEEEEEAAAAAATAENEDEDEGESEGIEEEEGEDKGGDEEEGKGENESEGEGAKKKKTAQDRIDEITWKFRNAEIQAAYWKKEADKKPGSVETPETPADTSDRPALENFETATEYEDALFGWYDKKKVVANEKTVRAATVKKNVGIFNKNAAEFKKTHKDFDMVVETPIFTDAMRSVLFTMEGGPEVAYYIAKNPQVGITFEKFSPEQQIFEIAKIQTKIKLAHKTRTITNASDPIEPVGDTGQSEKDPDKMTTDEWMAWNKKRDLAILEKKLGE
jgi:hypothetical protein